MTDQLTYLIYDLEIRKAILPKGCDPEPGVEYCAGWHDHENMGVSCLCAYDSVTDRFRVYFEDNKDNFVALTHERDLLVGFNNILFDDAVLLACGWPISVKTDRYDLLRELWIAKGLDPENFSSAHAGHGLEACSVANGGTPKTGWGGHAPVDWQEGRYGALVDYCIEDVRLTKRLFNRVIKHGNILDPIDSTNSVPMRNPS